MHDLSENTWYRVLVVLNLFFVCFGVCTAWVGFLPPSSLWGEWVSMHFFGESRMPHDAQVVYDFMRGPLGGTMAGSYLLQTMIVWVPLRRGERWAFWTIVGATSLWFVVDSAVSIWHGAWFNVIRINLFALGVMFFVLFALWRSSGVFRAQKPVVDVEVSF